MYPGDGKQLECVRILAATDPRKVAGSIASLNRKWWKVFKTGAGSPPELTLTRYYPYYFQSWKVTAPKTLGRTVKVALFTGVNGMNRSVGPATEWPVGEELAVPPEEMLSPHTSEAEAEKLSNEYIEKFVARRYRPSKPSSIVRDGFDLIYVPYYVYARESQPLRKAALIEGFTGAIGQVKDVPPIYKSIENAETVKLGEGR